MKLLIVTFNQMFCEIIVLISYLYMWTHNFCDSILDTYEGIDVTVTTLKLHIFWCSNIMFF